MRLIWRARQAYVRHSDLSPPTMVVSVISRLRRSRPMRPNELQLAAAKKEADKEAREEELDRHWARHREARHRGGGGDLGRSQIPGVVELHQRSPRDVPRGRA